MIKYSLEKLYKYHCGKCDHYASIGDGSRERIRCPACGSPHMLLYHVQYIYHMNHNCGAWWTEYEYPESTRTCCEDNCEERSLPVDINEVQDEGY